MPAPEPAELLRLHLERLAAMPRLARSLDEVLTLAGLARDRDRGVRRLDGAAVTERDCAEYKRRLREVLGDATYSFAKVNFMLGGCRCEICRASAAA